MKRSRLVGIGCGLIAIFGFCGCRNFGKPDKKYDLLTAEIRTRDQQLLATQSELAQLRLMNEAYQQQLGLAPPGGPTPVGVVPGLVPGMPIPNGCPPGVFRPASTPALPVQSITLASGTGGFDNDQCLGDEALQVVIVPKDSDDSPVKAPGRAAVACYEVTPEGLKIPIGRWEVSPEELRKVWRTGFLSSGYFVLLQWDRPPTTKRLRIVVRFVTLDGREYEADKDANVVPLTQPAIPIGPPPTSGEPIPPPTSPLPTVPPPSLPELPPPAGLDESPAATLGRIKPTIEK